MKADFGEFAQKLEESRDFADVFELVKDAVEKTTGKSRAGLMLGLSDLGGSKEFLLGAYYPVDSNIIVMNTFPLKRISESKPELLRPYVFQILLHEYIHSVGVLDGLATRKLTHSICLQTFGEKHLSSRLAKNMNEFLPELVYPEFGWFPKQEPEIMIVSGFDKGHLTYVS